MTGINPAMTPKELMESFVPELIGSKLGSVTFKPLKDDVQIDVIGAGQWVAKIENGKPTISPGNVNAPLVTVVVSADAIKMGIERAAGEVGDIDSIDISGPVQQMAEGLTQEVLDSIRAQIQGSIKFAVTTAEGREEFAVVGFNGINVSSPTCTVKTTESELFEIAASGLKPQEAFMAGKIRIDGDLSPVMMLVVNAMPLIEPGMEFLTRYLKGK